ncbi:hypothetical protein K438DRAFT_1802613 [Mycena galopus ATCC 62051]|nr:hypothetical protein K438DRAFT_1802613 [Mycena galopus ATCC 62051]
MSLADSPFVNRLNTNYAPSDSELFEIRALLVAPAEELARIDAQINEMEITLGQLKEQRASLKRPIDAHRALISPIRRIPQDVLLEIFGACLPSEHNALIDPAEAPLVLGRICRHWRSVAYSTPMLWSSIHIPSLNYLRVPPGHLLRLERVVEAWLERSGTCALSVSFFDHTNHFLVSDLEVHPLILRLLPVSRRLCHLTLEGDAEFFRPLLRLGPEDLPLLKHIWIKSTAYPAFEDHPDFTTAMQIPTLEDLSLIAPLADAPSLPVKWSQLTRLRLECYQVATTDGGLDLGGALDVLRRCPNLAQCELVVTKASEDPGLALINTAPIILPHMEALVLGGWPFFEKWLSFLVVPNLLSLRIGEAHWGDRANSADINPIQFTSSSLRELLQSFPMISHLRLFSSMAPSDIFLGDEFMELFYPPHDLCPELSNITILACTGFSDTAVLAFIKARMTMPTPLQHLRIQFHRPMDVDIWPELQSFILDGLQVTLEYPTVVPQWEFNARTGLVGDGLFY